MIITQFGNILRSPVAALRLMGRATQGVRLINLRETDTIASVATVAVNEEPDDADKEDVANTNENTEEIGKEFED
jgi:DNA gyrase subunit A